MALPTASDNAFPSILITEGTEPTAPAAGKQRLYVDSTSHKLKRTDSSGVDVTTEGALVFLQALTASASSSLDFTTFISSTYDTYKIEGTGIILATNTANLLMEMGTGAGPTWDTGNTYEWVRGAYTTGGTGNGTIDFASTGICRLLTTTSNSAAFGFGTFSLTATNLQSTALRKTIHGQVYYVTSTGPAAVFGPFGMQWTTSGTAVTGIRFIASSGNITSGTIRIYGLAKS